MCVKRERVSVKRERDRKRENKLFLGLHERRRRENLFAVLLRINVTQEVKEMTGDDTDEFGDGISPNKNVEEEKHPGKIHGLGKGI